MGDTCHHCKGDTWHRMTSAGDWASTIAGYVVDMWIIRHLKHNIILLVVEVPRGLVMGFHVAPYSWFVVYVKLYGFTMGRTPDLSSGQWTGRTRLTTQATSSSY
jgi:hypothetical protein